MTTIDYSINNGYIALPQTTTAQGLQQAAMLAIASQIPGWVPIESAPEVILLEQFAAMCAETATVAAQVPLAIFMYFGSLIGIDPLPGASATVNTTWTFQDSQGYTVPAGTQVAFSVLGNQLYVFQTSADFTCPAGQNVMNNIPITASSSGVAFNGITPSVLTLISPLSYVQSVISLATTAGGADAETQTAYLNRLSNELQFIAPRPILAADYAGIATNIAGVFRAVGINGLSPGRTISPVGVTNGSPVITCSTADFTAYDIGRSVVDVTNAGNIAGGTTISSIPNSTVVASGTGVVLPAGTITLASTLDFPSSGTVTFQLTANTYTTVSYTGISGNDLTGCSGGTGTITQGMVAYCGSQATMSHNAAGSSTGLGDTITLGDLTNQERTVAVCAVDTNGNAISSATATELQSYLVDKREANFVVNLLSPTYTPISVTWTGYCNPTASVDSVLALANAAVEAYLSQANWGGGDATTPTWDPAATVVRYNVVLSLLGSTPGMQYVSSMTMGIDGGTMGTVDITLPGDAPLAQVGAITGNVLTGT